jgi:hypothetical protein
LSLFDKVKFISAQAFPSLYEPEEFIGFLICNLIAYQLLMHKLVRENNTESGDYKY